MKIFNADGSEVEMCGNGIRCFAKYIWGRHLSGKQILDVKTLAGIIRPKRSGNDVCVDMGNPFLIRKNPGEHKVVNNGSRLPHAH